MSNKLRLNEEDEECSDEDCEQDSQGRRLLAESEKKESRLGSDNLILNMGIMLVVALAILIIVVVDFVFALASVTSFAIQGPRPCQLGSRCVGFGLIGIVSIEN